MNLSRIIALINRYTIISFRRFDRVITILYWPVAHITLWGLTSSWLQQKTHDPHLITLFLVALILWQTVFRVYIETSKSLTEEIIQHNVVALFSTPLTLAEWIVSMFFMAIINMVIITITSSIVAWLMYGIDIFRLGWYLCPLLFSLMLSGLAMGLFICGLIIYWGLKMQDFIFSVGWILSPLSAIYYPVHVLPPFFQKLAQCVPMSYVFEAMRSILRYTNPPPYYVLISYLLNAVYLVVAIAFFYYMFKKSKESGLARLD